MVQFRAMDDDADDVARVLAVVLPLLDGCPDLVVSGPRRLRHDRGGGGRVVFEVLLAGGQRPRWVDAERVDEPAPRPTRRRLPRGQSR